jgi:hypothetical protein
MRQRLCVATAGLILIAANVTLAQTQFYSLALHPGFNAVANHLDNGSNTLNEVFPDMPEGATFFKWDASTQGFYDPVTFFSGFGWSPPSVPEAGTLHPGQGAFIYVEREITVAVIGVAHPFQPRPEVASGYNLVSCQSGNDCEFIDVFGFEPRPGDVVYKFDQPFQTDPDIFAQNASRIHTYKNAGWDTPPVFTLGAAAGVFLSRAPRITLQPTNQTVIAGSNLVLAAQAFGAQPMAFQWMLHGTNLPGEVRNVLVLTNLPPELAGLFALVASNQFGVVTSKLAFVRVLTPPVITRQPQSVTAKMGDAVTLAVTATGTQPLGYTWYHDDLAVPYPQQGSPTLALGRVQATDAGSYFVVVSNVVGAATSAVVTVTVKLPPRVTRQPIDVEVGTNATVTFSAAAVGTPPLSFQWRKNGVNIPDATNSSYTINGVIPDDAGAYDLAVENEAGAASSDPAQLQIILPVLPLPDAFASSPVITEADGVIRSSNLGASRELGEPFHYGKYGGSSVWMTWVAATNGIVTFRSAGSSFDTLLASYTGSTVFELAEVASDDDGGGFLTSEIRFNATAGQRYRIALDGLDGAEGDIILSWHLEPTTDRLPTIVQQPVGEVTLPSNDVVFVVETVEVGLRYQWYFNGVAIPDATDYFLILLSVREQDLGTYFVRVFLGDRWVDSRPVTLQFSYGEQTSPLLPLPEGDKLADVVVRPIGAFIAAAMKGRPHAQAASLSVSYTGTQIFNTRGSVKQPGEPNHCGVVGGASQWFAYIAPTNGMLFLNTEGSSYDTVVAVYTGPGDSFATLVEVACDNNSGSNGLTSKLSFPATMGTPYYIAVDGVRGATGTLRLNYRLLVPLRLSNVAKVNNACRFRVIGTPSAPFSIQQSSNLVHWVTLLTTNSNSGTFLFMDTNVAAFSGRVFYRAMQIP